MISGVVVCDVADCNLVLLPALLDVVLALGYLVLQLPHLQHPVGQWEGRGLLMAGIVVLNIKFIAPPLMHFYYRNFFDS